MSGAASCREIRQALGVYVLGAIDPAERAVVDQHLAVCPDCREELAGLAGLPAMLRKVPISEAERLTMPELDLGADQLPTKEILDSLVARTANVRRIHRWRGLAAAAAVAILALGGGVAVTSALQPSGTPAPVGAHWLDVAHTEAATGARIEVKYRRMPWGTDMQVHVTGLKPGSVCEFVVTNSRGQSLPVGGWRLISWNGSPWYPATTWWNENQLQNFELTVNGKVVASVPAD
jgi:anti-sigma factor RsiW